LWLVWLTWFALLSGGVVAFAEIFGLLDVGGIVSFINMVDLFHFDGLMIRLARLSLSGLVS
jgi:hypothetical protein